MRFIKISWILIILFMTGCGVKEETKQNVFGPSLLSDEQGKVAIYAVGQEMTFDSLRSDGVHTRNISTITNGDSLSDSPILELEKEPAFAVFDTTGVVFKTYDYEELLDYLENHVE